MLTGIAADRIDALCAILFFVLGTQFVRGSTDFEPWAYVPLWAGFTMSCYAAFYLGTLRWSELLGLKKPSALTVVPHTKISRTASAGTTVPGTTLPRKRRKHDV
jgi:hypothetical protein